jgi:hypothetical protein
MNAAILIAFTLAGPARCLEAAAPRSLTVIHDRFIEAVETADRKAALNELSQTPPASLPELKAIFDIFMRFPEKPVREAVLSALRRMQGDRWNLESGLIEYLKLPESEAQIFAMTGLLRLRSPRALPLITDVARRKLRFKSPGEAPLLAERNAWWATYEALSTLAQWEGPKTLALLLKKTDEAPATARIAASFLWKDTLPEIIRWSGSGRLDREKAQEALAAEVPLADLRATRPQMLKAVMDRNSPRELRHQLALKIGFCAEPADIEDLLARERSAVDSEARLMLAAALFASRSPLTVPWLKETALKSPEPKTRIGALLQLREMLPGKELKPLAEEFSSKDPDAFNRESAADMIKAL